MNLVNDHTQGRIKLAEALPLITPLSIFINAASICNFRCNYCEIGLSNKSNADKYPNYLSLETANLFAEQAKAFPQKIKTITLASLGEPLLNPQIAEIVSCLKQAHICNNIAIVTNASKLTPQLSDKLINAGLDTLRISIQGLDEIAYQDVCNANINFEGMVNNIRYFYENKKSTRLYIKIMDEQLRDEEEKGKFLSLFGDICDDIAIEHLVPLFTKADEKTVDDYTTTINGLNVKNDLFTCARVFMTVLLHTNGDVGSCCIPGIHVLGNINEKNIIDIWNSEKRVKMLLTFLKDGKKAFKTCEDCQFPRFEHRQEDYLDDYTEQLYNKYLKLLK